MVKKLSLSLLFVFIPLITVTSQTDVSAPLEEQQQEKQEAEQKPVQTYTGVVPESVRRPEQLVNAVYPVDLSIGELGPGDATPEAYLYTRRILGEVQQGKEGSTLLSAIPELARRELIAQVKEITPRKYRVGGGIEQIDGSTSFMFRFIGREQELAGEVYIRAGDDGVWKLEDLLPEAPRSMSEARELDHPYSWSPYDRMW
ncbi:MAG: hypothetical protein LBC77_02280 [Spirochaetaceae bacterium]|jgi:hypothetical protein|nr:hypothetical protein [Spirochaetaceae bacterium]